MKALILTCNTGEGHNSTAGAIEETFTAHGVSCDRVDALSFLSHFVSKAVCTAHVEIYRYMPQAFDIGYRVAEDHPKAFQKKRGVYQLLALGKKKLYQYIVKGGYDTLICPHAFSELMATAMREAYPELSLRTCFVATDYTCSPSVSTGNMDLFFVPDDALVSDFIDKGIAPEKIYSSGIPVRRAFYETVKREEACAAHALPPHRAHILMMCGSMGCGPMEALTHLFCERLPSDCLLTVICGTNKSLYRRMMRLYGKRETIRVCGFVHDVPSLMDTADIYLTKPGGLSVTEGVAKAIPMVFVDAVAGCEEYNLRFFLERGMAKTADSPEGIVQTCLDLIDQPQELQAMREKLQVWRHNDAGEKIFEQLEKDLPKAE